MKRSDMIKILDEWLWHYGIEGLTPDGVDVLDKLKELGMLPPTYAKPITEQEARLSCTHYEMKYKKTRVNEWEPEDE